MDADSGALTFDGHREVETSHAMGAPSKWNDFNKFHFISWNNALVTAVCSPFAGMASDLPTFSVSPMAANSWRISFWDSRPSLRNGVFVVCEN